MLTQLMNAMIDNDRTTVEILFVILFIGSNVKISIELLMIVTDCCQSNFNVEC